MVASISERFHCPKKSLKICNLCKSVFNIKQSDVHQFRVGEIETTSDRELVYGETEGQQQNMGGLKEIVELGGEPIFLENA